MHFPSVRQRKLNSVQILRGLAALLVVIGHIFQHPLAEPPLIWGVFGAFGVQIFFVISGFIISYINPATFSPAKFIWRRFMRVAPLYWICTIFLALCAAYLPSLFKSTVFTSTYLWKSLAFFPVTVPGDPTDWRPLLKPGWTLNYEIFFYALFCLFWWCESGLRRAVMMSCILGVMIAGAFIVDRNSNIAAFYFNLNLMPFLAGIWIAELQRRGFWDGVSINSIPLIIFASAVSIAVLFCIDVTMIPFWVESCLYLTASVLLVVLALSVDRWLEGLSSKNIFLQIGDSSYSLYLTHMFVVGAGWAVYNRLGLGEWAVPFVICGIIIASLLIAKLSYILIEKRFIRVGHWSGWSKPRSIQPQSS